ncbi:unnamed protein product [Amaranthus hypochondriacus]
MIKEVALETCHHNTLLKFSLKSEKRRRVVVNVVDVVERRAAFELAADVDVVFPAPIEPVSTFGILSLLPLSTLSC